MDLVGVGFIGKVEFVFDDVVGIGCVVLVVGYCKYGFMY